MRYKIWKILLIIAALVLSACEHEQDKVMRIGVSMWPGYEPLFMGRELGYVDTAKIHLVEYSHMSQTVQYLRNGLIDAAALTLDQVLALLSTGEDLSIILVLDVSNGADAIVARPDIKDFTQLKGKNIGLENNILGAYVLSRAIELSQMSIGDVYVHRLNVDEQEAEFNKGKLDAVVTFDPIRARLLKAGNNVIFDTTQIPWEVVDVIVVRNKYMQEHPKNVQYFIDVWFKSLGYLKSAPDNAHEIIGKRLNLDVDDVRDLYDGLMLPDRHENYQLIKGMPEPLLVNTARRIASLMKKSGLIKNDFDASVLFKSNNMNYIENK